MGNVITYRTRDDLEKDKLKEFCIELIDQGAYVVLIAHRDDANITDLVTNLNFEADRMGIKGLVYEALEIVGRLAPVKVFEGDGGE